MLVGAGWSKLEPVGAGSSVPLLMQLLLPSRSCQWLPASKDLPDPGWGQQQPFVAWGKGGTSHAPEGASRAGDKHTQRVPSGALGPKGLHPLQAPPCSGRACRAPTLTVAATALRSGGTAPSAWGAQEHRQRCLIPGKKCWCPSLFSYNPFKGIINVTFIY